MTGFLWRMVSALVAAMVGLAMLFWSLERMTLMSFAVGSGGPPLEPPASVYLVMFAGLAVLNVSTFYALTQWSRYLRANPDTPQLPVWALVSGIVVGGGLLVTGIAQHSGWVRDQDQVPSTVNPGFVLYEVLCATLVLVPLVLLAVRWSPGYKRRPLGD